MRFRLSPLSAVAILALAVLVPGARAAAPRASTSLAQLSGKNACLSVDTSADNEPGCTLSHAVGGARRVAVSADGKFAYVAAATSDAIVTFARAADGALTQTGCTSDDATDGLYGATGRCRDGDALDGAVDVLPTADGQNVYVAAAGSSAVDTFNVGSGGLLTQVACLRDFVLFGHCADATALEGARALAISPDQKNLYVAANGDNASAVAIFARGADGSLTQTGCVSRNGSDGACVTGAGMAGPIDVDVSSDGRFVYVVTGGSSDEEEPGTVVTFARDQATGDLKQVGCQLPDAPEGPCTDLPAVPGTGPLALSPDGKNAYMAGDGLAIFKRDPSTGSLAKLACIQETESDSDAEDVAGPDCRQVDNLSPSDIAVSADGRSLFVAESQYALVAIFARDPSTGDLTASECIQEPDPEADVPAIAGCQHAIGIWDASSLALSPDGSSLYVAGGGEVAAFATAPAAATHAARVDRHGRTAIPVACPAASQRDCVGTLTIAVRGTRARGARATGDFAIHAGATRAVRMRLPARLRAAIARRGGATGRVVVRAADGRTRPLIRQIRLRTTGF